MNLQTEAMLSRVERTLAILWPESDCSVTLYEDRQIMANFVQLRMTFYGETIAWNTHIDAYDRHGDGFYEYLMRVIPQSFMEQLVERACKMSEQRFQPRGMQRAHPYRGH